MGIFWGALSKGFEVVETSADHNVVYAFVLIACHDFSTHRGLHGCTGKEGRFPGLQQLTAKTVRATVADSGVSVHAKRDSVHFVPWVSAEHNHSLNYSQENQLSKHKYHNINDTNPIALLRLR